MIELDRRAFVTGPAAVAGATVAPALPASAAMSPLRRFAFDWQVNYCEWRLNADTAAATRALLDSVWLYDLGWNQPPSMAGSWWVRHVASGLTFRQADSRYPASSMLALAYIETRSSVIPSYAEIHPIGYAAYETVVALRALERRRRSPFGSATGAVLIEYPDWELPDPLDIPFPLSVEDAPPLPPIAAELRA